MVCKDNLKKTIINAKLFKEYKIIGFNSELEIKYIRRLLELGFFINQSIQVLRKTTYGSAFLVSIRGIVVSVRKEIAQFVLLEEGDVV